MGIIYKLTSSKELKIYVGKTTKTPNKRFNKHKTHYKCWLAGKCNYLSSFELVKHDDCIMFVLESGISDDMLAERERYWHDRSDCVNLNIPNRSHAESTKKYRQDNRDYYLEYQKQYHENNREHELEYHKKYNETNKEKIAKQQSEKLTCSCGCIIARSSMQRHIKTSKKHESFMHNQVSDKYHNIF